MGGDIDERLREWIAKVRTIRGWSSCRRLGICGASVHIHNQALLGGHGKHQYAKYQMQTFSAVHAQKRDYLLVTLINRVVNTNRPAGHIAGYRWSKSSQRQLSCRSLASATMTFASRRERKSPQHLLGWINLRLRLCRAWSANRPPC